MTLQTLIDVATLAALSGAGDLAIIDCRFDLNAPAAGRRAFLDGHIPGARFADLNRDLSAPVGPQTGRHPLPTPTTAAATFTALGIGAGTRVVAYDQANGAFAARLWWMLRWLGHAEVAVLDGGFAAWQAAGGAVETGDATMPASPLRPAFVPHPDNLAMLETTALVEALGGQGLRLIDARAPERFAGSVEPIDTVAGHVPGATNFPFSANLGTDGHFLSRGELARRWRAHLQNIAPRNVVAMCGSGVTACHNLLALEHAGLPGARLYAGSWSEWIRDPARPVARGAP